MLRYLSGDTIGTYKQLHDSIYVTQNGLSFDLSRGDRQEFTKEKGSKESLSANSTGQYQQHISMDGVWLNGSQTKIIVSLDDLIGVVLTPLGEDR